MSKRLHVEGGETIPTYVCTFHLPVDLMVEILSRLPVKSLLRFSTMCKTWNSIIKSTNFISKHLKQYPLNPNFTCSSVFVSTKYEYKTDRVYETCFHMETILFKLVNIDFGDLNKRKYFKVVGVCDGLICVSLSYRECDFVICNPATRQFYKVPTCEQWNIDCLENGWAVFGFGLRSKKNLANDYKLVRITCTFKSTGEVVRQAQIYSMSSDNWRVVDLNMPFGYEVVLPDDTKDAMMINGVLYWHAEKFNSDDETGIVSFNVNDEVLQFVDLPKCCHDHTYDIIQWKGKVAVIRESNDRERFIYDVWLLNADTSCWSKELEFEILPGTEFSNIYFIGSVKNRDLIFQDLKPYVSQIYSYDPVSKEIKRWDHFSNMFLRNYCYVESLLPVKNNDHTLAPRLRCSQN